VKQLQFGEPFAQSARVSEGVFIHFANISLANKYFYMSTPKVASSSLLMTLQRVERDDPAFSHTPISNVHTRALSPLFTPYQVEDFWRTLDRDLFKFCIVRDPFERAISAYLDKVLPPQGGLGGRVATRLGVPEPVSFESFLEMIALEDPVERDPHYAVQHDHLCCDHIQYDLVGRFEDLERAFADISAGIGIDISRFSARIDHHFTGEKDLRKFLTPRALELMRQIYRQDFDTFEYPDQAF